MPGIPCSLILAIATISPPAGPERALLPTGPAQAGMLPVLPFGNSFAYVADDARSGVLEH